MRIRVIHEGGEIEIITLVPPIKGVLGKNLNRLACGDGTDFFFTQEGFYDGWARGGDGMTKEQMDETVQRMEDGREMGELIWEYTYCPECKMIVPYKEDFMAASDKNPDDSKDVVCDLCDFVITTYHKGKQNRGESK